MQPAACIAAVATRPAEQAESETVRQGGGKAAAAGVFRKGQEGTRNEERNLSRKNIRKWASNLNPASAQLKISIFLLTQSMQQIF
jgi:hypothetical protein